MTLDKYCLYPRASFSLIQKYKQNKTQKYLMPVSEWVMYHRIHITFFSQRNNSASPWQQRSLQNSGKKTSPWSLNVILNEFRWMCHIIKNPETNNMSWMSSTLRRKQRISGQIISTQFSGYCYFIRCVGILPSAWVTINERIHSVFDLVYRLMSVLSTAAAPIPAHSRISANHMGSNNHT